MKKRQLFLYALSLSVSAAAFGGRQRIRRAVTIMQSDDHREGHRHRRQQRRSAGRRAEPSGEAGRYRQRRPRLRELSRQQRSDPAGKAG